MNLGDVLQLLGFGAIFGAVFGYNLGRWHEARAIDRLTRRALAGKGGRP